MPVAAVTFAGKPTVSSASRIAQSGRSCEATTPFFSDVPVVTIEIGVTSEPVPAVGRRQYQRQTFAGHQADTIHLADRLVRVQQDGD